jgi:adenylate cyclase
MEQITRRLTAILAADVVGYSSMMETDESATLSTLRRIWDETFNPAVAARHGRIVKTMGDGALVEFGSVVEAVECALAIQRTMAERNRDTERRIDFRIGINLGDVIIEGDDIFGDGVNIAARLEGQASRGGILLSDVVHAQVSGKIGVTFSDAGEIKLKNMARPLRAWKWDGVEAKPPARSVLDLGEHADRPSIAVLPFSTLSNDPEQEFFADGLVEDILTTLAKLSGLSVIARNSSFVYKGGAVDVRQVARELGVRYVLEGGVRKSGNRVRITAQLVDATSGVHIWADRFDRGMADIFAVQDEITLTLATEMQVRLTEGNQARLRYTTTSNVEAWSLWIEGLNLHRGPMSRDVHLRTQRCWERALALDPDSATLNALLGFLHFGDARHGWTDDARETKLRRAGAYIERALSIDPENPDAWRSAGAVHLLGSRFDEAAAALRKAVTFGPSLPDVLAFASFVLACTGHAAEGIGYMERAIRLSPNHPAAYFGMLGNAYRLAGRANEAIGLFLAYHARNPGYGLADIVMIKEQAGQLDEARVFGAQLVAARPTFTVASWARTQCRSDVDQMAADLASLRAVGLPEE